MTAVLRQRVLPPIALLLAVVLIWEAAVLTLDVPRYLLPRPSQVARTAYDRANVLVVATAITGAGATCGYAVSLVLGSVVALLFSQSPAIRSSCYPYAIFLQTVPIVAIAPLIVIWFGSGFPSIVLITTMISLFPVITNGTAGLLAVDRGLQELFQLHRATRWQVIRKLQLPNAVPHFLTGAKTSSGLAVVGAIVGEFFVGYGAAHRGLGYYILHSGPQLKTDLLFAATIASALLGVVMFSTVSYVEQRVLSRWYSEPFGQR